MVAPAQPLATTLNDAYNVGDPDRPLGPHDSRRVSLRQVRGGGSMADKVHRRITRTNPPGVSNSERQSHQQLITGHRGCGKSTELMRLQHLLQHDQNSRFFVVYFDVEDVLDVNNIEYLDILLWIDRPVYDAVAVEKIRLDAKLLHRMKDWFAQTVLTSEQRVEVEASVKAEVEAKAGIPLLGQILARLSSQFKVGSSQRHEVRRTLDRELTVFLAYLNELLDHVHDKLTTAKNPWRGLVVIVDGLEKMPLLEQSEGGTNHSTLFITRAAQLKAPRCHLVYTVPVSLVFNANLGVAWDLYEVMPMVKVAERESGAPYTEGRDALREVVGRRVDVQTVFESTTLVDRLVEMSGGAMRDLIRLVRLACDEAETVIDAADVERAVRNLIVEYDRLLRDSDLDQLVQVASTNRVTNDEASARFLYQRLVLEYQNGEPWYDLHPAVRATSKIQERLQRLATAATGNGT